MKRSTDRILTTHAGSLPRPPDLTQMMYDRADRKPVDQAKLEERIDSATAEVVRKQMECGLDVIHDGEFSKVGYSTYVTDRLTGFQGESEPIIAAEMQDYPEYWQRMFADQVMEGFTHLKTPACTGPVSLKDPTAVQRDIDTFRAAIEGAQPVDTFFTAASPGVIAVFFRNRHYPSEEAYLGALADAMKPGTKPSPRPASSFSSTVQTWPWPARWETAPIRI